MKNKTLITLLLTFSLLATLTNTVAAQPGPGSFSIEEFEVGEISGPTGVVTAFGAVWFTEDGSDSIGKLNPQTREVVHIESPKQGIHGAITAGFGSIWFAPEVAPGTIFRLDPETYNIREYPLPVDAAPARLTTGFGYVWYTSIPNNVIGRLNPRTGEVIEIPIPTEWSIPVGITTGFGSVWFGELNGKVGRLNPQTNSIQEYGPLTGAFGVATGYEKVWFTGGFTGNVVGYIDPMTGEITEFDVPTLGSLPVEITTGFGSVWFTEISANKIGRIDPQTGEIVEFDVPTGESLPFGITQGLNGIWFVEQGSDTVGLVTIDAQH